MSTSVIHSRLNPSIRLLDPFHTCQSALSISFPSECVLALLHVVDFQRLEVSLVLGFFLKRGLHWLLSSFSFTSLTPFHPTASVFPLTSTNAILRCDLITIANHIHVCIKLFPLTFVDAILRCNLIAHRTSPLQRSPPQITYLFPPHRLIYSAAIRQHSHLPRP